MSDEIIARLLTQLRARGSQPGLDRIRAVLTACGDPQNRLRVLHIAGTNGKGSTACLLQNVLTAAGYRTGLYISPAVLSPFDGIEIDGTPLTEETFCALSHTLLERCGEDAGGLTEFEWMTVIALLWFAEQHVDFAVIECGMGGAQDATNVFDSPLAAIFTPIALDHTAWLGDTVEAIAREKSGIIRGTCAIISSPDQSTEALGVLMACAAERGLTVHIGSPVKDYTITDNILSFPRGEQTYRLSTINPVQAQNAVTVLETVNALRNRGIFLPEEAVVRGLFAAHFPARQEWFPYVPPILLDSAHNPHGINSLARTLESACFPPPILLLGMLRDKDVAACVRRLSPLCDKVICCTPHSPRALSAHDLAAHFPYPVQAIDDLDAAFDAAYALACRTNRPLVVGGSFYVSLPLRPKILSLA